MNDRLAAVGLRTWPFDVVPPASASTTWYGRPSFRADLERVTGSWEFRRSSSIYLLWADFGAGKTHALRYIEGLCQQMTSPAICVYAELPSDVGDFHGVYAQIAQHLPEEPLAAAVTTLRSRRGGNWLDDPGFAGDRDTPRVLWQLADMPREQAGELARRWLRGERLLARELQSLGGVSAIRSSDDARRVLVSLRHLLVEYAGFSRFVLLLDEFQRVGQASRTKLQDVNSGLHTLFNACPSDLSIVLSYSIGVADAIRHLVTEELMSRVEEQLSLPMLSRREAEAFVTDVLGGASTNGAVALSPESITRALEQLDGDSSHRITPRRVMQVFGAIYQGLLAERSSLDLPLSADRVIKYYRKPTADAMG